MSSNETYSSRSMNGIIDIYGEDIVATNIDAENIDVENLAIENNLLVQSTNISPLELSYLDNLTGNIQTQINNITANGVVDLTSTQTISGDKTFSGTTSFTGDIDVNNSNFTPNLTSISPAELSVLDGIDTTQTLQTQLNNAGIGNAVTTNTDQVITGQKTFTAPVGIDSVVTSDSTGTFTGFKISNTELLYNTTTGIYTTGQSVITGIDIINSIMNSIDTNTQVVTLNDNQTRQSAIGVIEGYIRTSTLITLKYNSTNGVNIIANQGFTHSSLNNFVGSITNYDITNLLTQTITPVTSSANGIVALNGKFVSLDTITGDPFVEGTGLTRPSQISGSGSDYNLFSQNAKTSTPQQEFINGFSYGNLFYIPNSSTNTLQNDFIQGGGYPAGSYVTSVNTGNLGTSNSLTDTHNLQTYGCLKSGLRYLTIMSLASIQTGSGIFNTTDNDFGFTQAISNNYYVDVDTGLNNTSTLTPVTNNTLTYFSQSGQLVCRSNKIGKLCEMYNANQLCSIDSQDSNNSMLYNVTSNQSITPTTGATLSGYKYNATTLVVSSLSGNSPFLFEVAGELNQYGSLAGTSSTGSTYYWDAVSDNTYVSTPTTITGAIIDVGFLNHKTFLYGNSSSPSLNQFLVTATYSPVNCVTIVENPSSGNTNHFMTNAFTLDGKENNVTPQPTPTTREFLVYGGVRYINTFSVSVNNIIESITTGVNHPLTGSWIGSITNLKLVYEIAVAGYTTIPSDDSPDRVNLLYNTTTSSGNVVTIITPTSSFNFTPVAGDFVRFFNNTYISYATSISVVGSSYHVVLAGTAPSPINLYNETDLFWYRKSNLDQIRIYTPLTTFLYTPQTINKYTNKFNIYDKETINFYTNKQIGTYRALVYTLYQKISGNISFFTNNSYTINTTADVDFRPVVADDYFVLESQTQTLTNKTLTSPTLTSPTITGSTTLTSPTINTPTITGGTLTNSTISNPTFSGSVAGISFSSKISSPNQPVWWLNSTNNTNQNYGAGSRIGSSQYLGGYGLTAYFGQTNKYNTTQNAWNYQTGIFTSSEGAGIYLIDLYVFCNNATAFSGRISLQTFAAFTQTQFQMNVNRNTATENCALLSWTWISNATNNYFYIYTHSSVMTTYLGSAHTAMKVTKIL